MRQTAAHEKDYHNRVFSDPDYDRGFALKASIVAHASWRDFWKQVEQFSLRSGTVSAIEYGYGLQPFLAKISRNINFGLGIDISNIAIEKNSLNLQFSAGDGNNFTYKRRFDLIYGAAILHHLSIANLLEDNGAAIFHEPLGTNPFINVYRLLTPSIRTRDEHLLLPNHFRQYRRYFYEVIIKVYSIWTLLLAPFAAVIDTDKLGRILERLEKPDEALLSRAPGIKWLGWTRHDEMKKPIRSAGQYLSGRNLEKNLQQKVGPGYRIAIC